MTQLPTRKLGRNGPVVPALGFGTSAVAGYYGAVDSDADAVNTIRHAIDAGATFIDTSAAYEFGLSEIHVGRAIAGRRDEVTVATKFGVYAAAGWAHFDGSPKHVRGAVDISLGRLKTDVIDLWYLHRVDPEVPIEETVGAMGEEVRKGKVRYLGLSDVTAEQLRRASKIHPIAALQSEWSLSARAIEGEILDTARELGIGLVPFSPLGRGLIAGGLKSAADVPAGDWRANMPRFKGDAITHNIAVANQIAQIAAELGITPAQLALAWLLHQGDDVVPIPGSRRAAHVESNLRAVDVTLSAADIARVEAVAAGIVGG